MKRTTAFLLVVVTALSMPALSQVVSVLGLPDHGLTLVAPGSPEFDSLLARLTSTEQRLFLQSLLPFSTILVNHGTRTVLAHTLLWHCTGPDGRRTRRTYTGGTDVLNVARGPKVAPSEAILVTPLSSGTVGSHPAPARALQDLERFLRLQQKIVIHLDGVLFEDGSFAGPNQSKIRDQHEGRFAACGEIQSTILTKEKQGEQPEAIFAWLKSLGDTNVAMPGEGASSTEWYRHWRSLLAHMVMRIRSNSGDTAALEAVHKMKAISIVPTR